MSDDWLINTRFKVEEPEKVRMTLTVTASMKDWGKLRDNLDHVANKCLGVAPLVHQLRRDIDDMYSQARRIYWPTESASNEATEE